MNNSLIPKENGKQVTFMSGIGKLHSDKNNHLGVPFVVKNGGSEYSLVFYGTVQERLNDIFSFELFPFGSKLSEDLFKGSFLYISTFQSLYLLGFNYGIVIASLNQKINFYTSSRMDYIMILNWPAEGFYGEGKYSANTSSIGINFKEKDFIVFMEFIAFFPIKTYSIRGYIDREGNSIDTIDTLYTERFYSFQLGVSF